MSELTETERRKARAIAQRTGIVPGPNSPLLQVSGRTVRSEDDEEQLCDIYVGTIAGPEAVVRLSQRRASHVHLGLPDRRYRIFGLSFFFEVKAADGKMSVDQHRFLLAELSSGALACVGTLETLQSLLQHVRPLMDDPAMQHHVARQFCVMEVGRWAAKGYRKPATPRTRRGRR